MISEIGSRTTDIDAAAWGASLSMSAKITMLAIWTLPASSTIAPNSPTPRANDSAAPEKIAWRIEGKTMRLKVVQFEAPSEAAHSSASGSSSISTG